MNTEEQSYGLMTLAQEQQKTAQATLERLAIEREQATLTALDKRAGRVRWGYCGPQNRLCFEIAPDQGGRTSVPYQGAWQNTHTGAQFVIPRGY